MMSVVDKKFCSDGERELTVRKVSMFSSGDGFEAYDHRSGEIVFRVDTYQDRSPKNALGHEHQLVLMDPYGSPILTVRSKWSSLHHRWEGFVGDKSEGQKPLFSVKKSSMFGDGRSVVAEDLHGGKYRIEGSFARRNCKIVLYYGDNINLEKDHEDLEDDDHDEGAVKVVAAEITRKVDQSCANVVLSKDVFCLSVKPGIDAAFVMGIVLVLDQITGDADYADWEQDPLDVSSDVPSSMSTPAPQNLN